MLHLDFASAESKQVGLEKTLLNRLAEMAAEHQIALTVEGPAARFQELLQQLASRVAKVAILIDEYGRPINESLDNLPLAEPNRDLLRDFFSVVVRERRYYEKHLPFGKKIYLPGLVCADKGVKDWKLAQAWPTTP